MDHSLEREEGLVIVQLPEVEGHLRDSGLLPDPGSVQAVSHALLHSKHQVCLLVEGGVVSAVLRWLEI